MSDQAASGGAVSESPTRRGLRLVELDCASCGAPLAAEGHDVVYYCTACYNGYLLDTEADRLLAVEVSFVGAPAVAAERHLPFWLLPAEVELLDRQASGGGFGRLLSLFTGGGGDGSGPRSFVIPAYDTPLARMVALAARYTASFPTLGERLGERLTGGCFGPADAEKLAHYVLITAEADKSDTLKDLSYELRFGEPRLLGVPFARRGRDLVDGLFGLPA